MCLTWNLSGILEFLDPSKNILNDYYVMSFKMKKKQQIILLRKRIAVSSIWLIINTNAIAEPIRECYTMTNNDFSTNQL